MAIFKFKAFTTTGLTESGSLDAASATAARQALADRGLKVFELSLNTSVGKNAEKPTRLRRQKFNPERFFSDLSVLTEAGLGLDKALKALAENHGANSVTALKVLDHLSNGSSPSQAFATIEQLPEDVLALVSGGEQTGRLSTVFGMIATELTRSRARKQQIIEAISYPIFLLIMMLLAMTIVTLFLVPAILPIFESAGQSPPVLVAALGTVGDFLQQWGGVILILLSGSGLFFVTPVQRAKSRKWLFDILTALPLIGTLIKKHYLVRYLRSLALSLGNGLEMQKALLLANKTCSVTSYRAILDQMKDQVVAGKTFPEGLQASGIFPPAVLSLASIGDAVNGLPKVLSRAADILDDETTQLQKRILAALSPAITILMGLLIGSLVISVMSALLSINELSLQ